ncbi:lipopolysaccharide assembly protein LapA domain-containing protein [Frankia sp. Cppng1_Ct_nod]|uniref:lipopolysaccharide assembly protein LapA domain-containing protein n=1 Tax=Frankia sp. Cppng1_Ct_nod TaxID=2897162 RepID=UPI001F5E6325|nr:lipopolysaccharide assembly protein LapA domain-containing protein [Frankia sp. Cppng1_Ct_nod]
MTTPGEPTRKIDYNRPASPPPAGTTTPGPFGSGTAVPGPPGPGPGTGVTGPETAGPGPVTPPGTAPEPTGRRRGVGYTTYAITVLVMLIAILMIVFVVQNNARVNIWLFGSIHNMSVAGALAASAAAGLLVGLLIGLITQIRVRKELRQYRRGKR